MLLCIYTWVHFDSFHVSSVPFCFFFLSLSSLLPSFDPRESPFRFIYLFRTISTYFYILDLVVFPPLRLPRWFFSPGEDSLGRAPGGAGPGFAGCRAAAAPGAGGQRAALRGRGAHGRRRRLPGRGAGDVDHVSVAWGRDALFFAVCFFFGWTLDVVGWMWLLDV